MSVTGEVGCALIWWNLRSDGSLDSRNCNLIADNSLVIVVVVLVRLFVVVVFVDCCSVLVPSLGRSGFVNEQEVVD